MKATSRVSRIFFLGFLLLAACSEKAAQPEFPNAPIELRQIPFATAQALLAWSAQDAAIADYRVVRMLSLIELNMSDKELSPLPVLLYDFDSSPRYYEFIVLDAFGQPTATLCSYARKDQAGVVAYMLPYLRNYQNLGVKSQHTQAFAYQYPSEIFYGIATRSGEAPQALSTAQGTIVSEMPPVQHQINPLAQIESMDAEYFEIMGITKVDLEVQKASLTEALVSAQADAKAYWEMADLLSPELISKNEQGWIKTKGSSTWIDEFVLPQYDTEPMQKTFWRGGCGPSAVANIYRGLYDSYNGMYLPIWGDPDFDNPAAEQRFYMFGDENDRRAVYFYYDNGDHDGDGNLNITDKEWVTQQSAKSDNGLYADLCDFGWYYFFGNSIGQYLGMNWGAALPINLTQSLERVTNKQYTISLLPIVAPHHHIRTQKLPVLLLRGDFIHYLNAFGSRHEYWQWETVFNLFGLKIPISTPKIITHSWLKINDNGNDKNTGKYNHLPYWMDDNISQAILRFGVYKK